MRRKEESSEDGGTGRDDGRRLLMSHYVDGEIH